MRVISEKIATRVEERDALVKRRTDVERRLLEAGTRYETLKRLEESGVGLYSGVKHVLDASRKNTLSGILGTLASLLVVPADLEAAIEAALGSHLQDLVVERWTRRGARDRAAEAIADWPGDISSIGYRSKSWEVFATRPRSGN